MKFRVILYQKPLGIPVTRQDVDEMRRFKPHFVCFPEYFFVNTNLGTRAQTPHNQARQLQRIAALSRGLSSVVIGGSMPELADGLLYNTCFVFQEGRLLGSYRKKRLFAPEVGAITPGDSYRVFSAHGITFGVMICADIFEDDGFRFMRENGARIIFSPTFSPRKQETVEDKYRRDNEIYVRGAEMSGAVIVKVCGVKSEFRDFLQARSLIADKKGVVFRARPEEEETPMIIMREIVA
ncbi:MAG: carbon-nitrogen hydrolase family protein [Spirochaetes bacterium]|nr:carbon-nitrogen hydrolase family protein [Spirochaetota bacterium]